MGTRLAGRYQIVRELGAGGMGRVFQAVDTETGRAVAAKVLIAGEEIDLQALLRFQQEGALLSALKHPNIVEVYGTHLEEHTSCIIMELLEGQSLAQILRDRSRLPLTRTKHLMRQVAAALTYAHGRGIVHRDIKPDNIMVVGDDEVKVTDFGIARILEGSTLNTQTGTSIGTPLYMSPEQIEGQRIDGRSDIYSFGALLYQMVTGRPPFEGADPLTIAFKHVHKAPEPPGEINEDIPEDWEALILKCLAKSPEDRVQTAAALEEALAQLDTSGQGATRLRTGAKSAWPVADVAEMAAREQEARTRLDLGRKKEITGELPSALRDYRAALTVAPPGAVRQELESSIARVTGLIEREVGPDASPLQQAAERERGGAIEKAARGKLRGVPIPWLTAGAALTAVVVVVALVLVFSRGPSKKSAPVTRPVPDSRGAITASFSAPAAVAVDSKGDVYVSDTGNNRIETFSRAGKLLGQWGSQGSGAGQFNRPAGLAVSSQGDVYVADAANNRIQELASTSDPVARWGTKGSRPGQFNDPEGVAIDSQGNLYVADTGNNRVQKLSASDKVLGVWGVGQLSRPAGVAVDSQGNVYIADTGDNRIQKFSASGKSLAQWGSQGSGPGQFSSPEGIAVDSQGNIFVADTGNNHVQELAPTSDPVAQWGSKGPGAGGLNGPKGVAVGAGGLLYVADTGNNRVQTFSRSSGNG